MAGGPHSGGKAPVGAGVGVGDPVPGADPAAVYAAGDVWSAAEPVDLDRSGKLVFSPFVAQSVGFEVLVSGFQSIQRCVRFAVNQRVDRPVIGGGLFADFRPRRLCAFPAENAAAGAVYAAVSHPAGLSQPDGIHECCPIVLSVGIERQYRRGGTGA